MPMCIKAVFGHSKSSVSSLRADIDDRIVLQKNQLARNRAHNDAVTVIGAWVFEHGLTDHGKRQHVEKRAHVLSACGLRGDARHNKHLLSHDSG